MKTPDEALPDVRDGLTREERVVLHVLRKTQLERGDRNVPTAMLWGRVCEHFYISPEDLSAMLARLGGHRRSRDVACQVLDLVTLRGLCRNARVQRKARALGNLRPRGVRLGR